MRSEEAMGNTGDSTVGYGECAAHPSLALIKYWGKADSRENIPATPSLAVTLDGLVSRTTVLITPSADVKSSGGGNPDKVFINGKLQDDKRFAPFFSDFRKLVDAKQPGRGEFSIRAESASNFPSSAGLASSSSGFAALACACVQATELDVSVEELSALARMGSASAARSLYGGFTRLDARSRYAEQLHDEKWWPEFRIVVLELEKGPKSIPSRQAMELTRLTSPYYGSWLSDSRGLMKEAEEALSRKDMQILGPLIRKSYLRMFATMLSADPPIIYWKPASLAVLHLCEEMRAEGISVWETMDAGPQVKLFCTDKEAGIICRRIEDAFPDIPYRLCAPGAPPVSKNSDNGGNSAVSLRS